MEGVPDVAYDEVKESHYRHDGLIEANHQCEKNKNTVWELYSIAYENKFSII